MIVLGTRPAGYRLPRRRRRRRSSGRPQGRPALPGGIRKQVRNILFSQNYQHKFKIFPVSLLERDSTFVQGDSGGLGLGYVDINSVSFGDYPQTELSQHNPVRDHQTHPVEDQAKILHV